MKVYVICQLLHCNVWGYVKPYAVRSSLNQAKEAIAEYAKKHGGDVTFSIQTAPMKNGKEYTEATIGDRKFAIFEYNLI